MYITVTYKRFDTYPFEQGDTIEVEDRIYPSFNYGDTEYPNGYYKIINPKFGEVEDENWIIDINDITIDKNYKLSKFRFV